MTEHNKAEESWKFFLSKYNVSQDWIKRKQAFSKKENSVSKSEYKEVVQFIEIIKTEYHD